ncbi:hypothetical protein OIU84_004156 [Salix udensis]|uniref:Uncharacterized protein n=1 Tax=Salix udensis TaxID=889485 RepID=A0AAD6K3P8_9ROSI|nr:hypothetical protein OIU84_004156 [Salix udensis]
MESLRKWSGEKSNATNFDMMGSDGTHELYMESCKRALHGMIWFAPHMKRFSAISSGFSCKTSNFDGTVFAFSVSAILNLNAKNQTASMQSINKISRISVDPLPLLFAKVALPGK